MIKKYGVIYSIKNKINGKRYIGQTIHPDIRVDKHARRLRKGEHINDHLQNAWNKYGKNNFIFEILEDEIPYDNLDKKEIEYIKNYNSFKNGYNFTPGGSRYEQKAVMVCTVCGKEYEGYVRKNNKYCSRKCMEKQYAKDNQIIKECEICGEKFETIKGRNVKTCSQSCAGKLSWLKEEREKHINRCQNCDKEYKTYFPNNSKFCSNKCQRDYRRKTKRWYEIKECVICGKDFETRKDTGAKTCSRSCSAKLAWKTKHEKGGE